MVETFVFGFVEGLVGLDEHGSALALHRDGGVVVEDVAALLQVTVSPDLEVGLASQPGGNLGHKHGDESTHQRAARAGMTQKVICAPIWKHKTPAVIATQLPRYFKGFILWANYIYTI